MTGPERRHKLRTAGGLAYLNIEPDNAGILLNISEGGLCFHSIAPIKPNGAIRVSFSEHNCRIEAEGKLIWTSESNKTVGLEFTVLSARAREQIRTWAIATEHEITSNTQKLRNAPALSPSRAAGVMEPFAESFPARPTVASTARTLPFRGFSGGLLTGLLLSILVAVSLLFYLNRRHFGESLIHLGERLASTPPVAVQSATSPTLEESPRNQEPVTIATPSNRNPKTDLQKAAAPAIIVPESQPENSDTTDVSPPPILVASETPGTADKKLLPEQKSNLPELERTDQAPGATGVGGIETGGTPSEMYLEVGKFKDTKAAHKAVDELAQMGFPANVVQKGHLWMNSYYVRVGHYRDRSEAEAAHRNLVSHGFKPITFEKGSRNFRFGSPLNLGDTRMPVGDCVVSWESYSDNAIVKFLQDDFVVATAHGKWEKRDVRYDRGALVYRRNRDGSQTLIEIRFAGMNQALVFAQTS